MADILLEPWGRAVPAATTPLPKVQPMPTAAHSPVPSPSVAGIAQAVTSAPAIAIATDKVVTARVLKTMANDIKDGKMPALPDRLTAKLTQAAGVLQRRVEASIARADALIARENALAKKEDDAFAPHEQAATALESHYDMVERAYDILGNGSGNSDEHSGKEGS